MAREGMKLIPGKRAETFQPCGNIVERGGVERGSATGVTGVKSLQHIHNFGTANLPNDEP